MASDINSLTVTAEDEHGLDFDVIDKDLEELAEQFYLCLEEGNLKSLEELVLNENFDVNLVFDAKYKFVKRKYHGWRALHISALNNAAKIAQFLIHEGAEVEFVTPEGDTALHLAAKIGAADIVSLLLEKNIFLRDRPNNQGVTALLKSIVSYHHAFKGNYRRCTSLLLSSGCNPNIPSSSRVTPLHVAVDQGDPLIVQSLINAGANVNAYCERGFIPILRALCVKYPNSEVLTSLLDAGADTSYSLNGRSLLHIAVSRCDDRVIDSFLKHGANPNVLDTHGKTPLWIAVEEDNIKVVSILVTGGADINYLLHPRCLSILSLAITNNSHPMVKLLLAHGAWTFNQNIVSTPLHLAVLERNIDIIRELIKYNCEMNCSKNMHNPLTPLQIAMESGSLEIIDLLIKSGCRVRMSWLKEDRLSPVTTKRAVIVGHLQRHALEVPSLLHRSRLVVREAVGPNFKQFLEYLKVSQVLPNKLIDYICLKDVLGS